MRIVNYTALRGDSASEFFDDDNVLIVVFATSMDYARQGHVALCTPKVGDPYLAARRMSKVPAVLSHLYVSPKFRLNGVGKELVRRVLVEADRRRWDVMLQTRPYRGGPSHANLRDLYAAHGFTSAQVLGDSYQMVRNYCR